MLRGFAMAQSKVRYAVVGLGYIAQAAVLPSFTHARRNSSLHAIVSGNVEKLNELGDKYRIPVRASYDEYERCLQAVDATGAPEPPDDPFSRGTPLAPRDAMFREALKELRDVLDYGLALAAWEASLAADTWDGPPTWIHGDLMPGNILVADGKLAAVIDFGTARAADPAGDLLAGGCFLAEDLPVPCHCVVLLRCGADVEGAHAETQDPCRVPPGRGLLVRSRQDYFLA